MCSSKKITIITTIFLRVEQNYVRKVFRETIISADLDYTYGYSGETYNRKTRTLHRLTTHSLRHYAITKFSKSNNGNIVLTSRYARHASPSTTIRYIAKDKEQLYKEIETAFSLDQAEKLKHGFINMER